MPIIEDVTYVDDKFQKKIIVQFYKRKRTATGEKKMYKNENCNIIRPRKLHGNWGAPTQQYSSSIFRIGDLKQDENDLTLTLPIDTYKGKRKKKTNFEATKTASRVIFNQFESYCDKSTLHGLRYVGDTSLTFAERFFWVIAFGTAFAFACYYITKILEKWNTNPVIVAFNPIDATFNDIPFPAITICNMNQIKKSEAERILQEQNSLEKELLDDYCNFNNNSYGERPPGWNVLQNFLIRAGQSCSDTLRSCYWQNENVSCDENFNNDLTDEGLCCSFNRLPAETIFRNPKEISFLNHTFPKKIYDWSPEKGFTTPQTGDMSTIPVRPVGSGTHLGLTIVVDARLDDFYCSSTNSYGFKIMLSNPIETPKIADFGFLVSPGVEARFVIKPEIKEATKTLRGVEVSKRQCYFQDERPLKYYRSYTTKNCRLECQSNHTLSRCNCIPYYLPKSRIVPVCGKRDEECVAKAKEDMELVYGNGSSCYCLQSCYEMSFDKSASYSDLFRFSQRIGLDNVTEEYFRRNMAVLHFFFKDNRFRRQIKSEIYGFTDVLSNVGGLLGLCFGFSFLSLIEICYYLSLRICCIFFHRIRDQRKKDKNRSTNSVIPFMR